ncbi:hypothetical protein AB0H45_30770 [Streptomyces atroolivaceus]|uniref:Uncharacterized protein n=1 Tax=Streptomyces atroolivaceus TaxID=66869 RepID=A0ABV9VB50_STRAZ|nr:hypothetical protein [Streptomyces atroolivaceus]
MFGLLRQLDAACRTGNDLTEASEEAFRQHPCAEVTLSFPGTGVRIDARLLATSATPRPGSPAPER